MSIRRQVNKANDGIKKTAYELRLMGVNLESALTVLNRLPTIVCLCGSTKFKDEYEAENERETLKGNIVLSVGCFRRAAPDGQREPQEERTKKALDELHKRKIDLADEILVINVGGYIGDSTRSEIEYAKMIGVPIRYLEEHDASNV